MNLDIAYNAADLAAARALMHRLDLLHADRIAMAAAGDQPAAVRDSMLIHDVVGTATVQQLRAAVILLTTPELRPATPVVVGPPAGPDNPSVKEGVDGLAAPTPPVVDHVMTLVAQYGTARVIWEMRGTSAAGDAVDAAAAAVRAAVEDLAVGGLAAAILRESAPGGAL